MMSFIFQIPAILGKALWEPIGILFWCGVFWLLWSHRKNWKGPLFFVVSAGLIFAFGWRFFIKLSTARYYLTFLLPALFIIFYFLRRGPWPKKISYVLLLLLFVLCLGKDLRHNEKDRQSGLLYQVIKEDAKNYQKPLMILYGGSASKAPYYTNLPSLKIGHSVLDRELYFESLNRNLNFYHGIVDCIYFCTEFRADEGKLLQRWKSEPRFTELGVNPDNGSSKKRKTVFKYVPSDVRSDDELSSLNVLGNGDFTELMSDREIDDLRNVWKAQLPCTAKEDFAFPQGWSISHSRTTKSDAVAKCIREKEKNVLDIHAEKNFISVITPFFPADKAVALCFSIRALEDSQIDLIAHLQNPKGPKNEFYPFFPIFMPAGAQKNAKIIIPAFPGRSNERIHFWLNRGHVRLSNVSIHPLTMGKSYHE